MANSPIKFNAQLGVNGRRFYDFVNRWYPKAGEIYVTSAYRPEEGGSHHSGLSYNGSPTFAVDYGARDHGYAEGNRRMRDFAKWLFDNFGDLMVEVIHTTDSHNSEIGFYIKNQRVVPPYAAADHGNHVHAATSAHLLDKMIVRAQQRWGGTKPPTPPQPPSVLYPDNEARIFGWDASDFDWDRGARPGHVSNAAREGIRFFTHKITEGTRFIHSHAGEMVKAAVAARIPFVGFYIVPRTPGNNGNGSISQQVDYAIAQANRQFPEWKHTNGFFWQVDSEHWGYDDVHPNYGTEMANLLEQRTGKKAVHYAPRWSYGDSIPGSHPLWASNYGSNPAVHFKTAYDRGGGDNHPGWDRYSGRVPRILQYGSRAVIGGMHTTDANVFKGSQLAFAKMIGAQTHLASNEGFEPMNFGKVKGNAAIYKALGNNTYVGQENWPAIQKLLQSGAAKVTEFDTKEELEFVFGKPAQE